MPTTAEKLLSRFGVYNDLGFCFQNLYILKKKLLVSLPHFTFSWILVTYANINFQNPTKKSIINISIQNNLSLFGILFNKCLSAIKSIALRMDRPIIISQWKLEWFSLGEIMNQITDKHSTRQQIRNKVSFDKYFFIKRGFSSLYFKLIKTLENNIIKNVALYPPIMPNKACVYDKVN